MKQFNLTSVNLMHHVSNLTGLLIGIDHKHNRYFVVSSKSGQHYKLSAGILSWLLGSTLFLGGAFAILIAPAGMIEMASEITWGLTYDVARVFAISACIAYIGYKMLEIFQTRPDFLDEDYEISEKERQYWIF